MDATGACSESIYGNLYVNQYLGTRISFIKALNLNLG